MAVVLKKDFVRFVQVRVVFLHRFNKFYVVFGVILQSLNNAYILTFLLT